MLIQMLENKDVLQDTSFLCNQYDNASASIAVNLPALFTNAEYNYFIICKAPNGAINQYSIPLVLSVDKLTFAVTSVISSLIGNWQFCIVIKSATGNLIAISAYWTGKVLSGIAIQDELVQQAEDANLKLLYDSSLEAEVLRVIAEDDRLSSETTRAAFYDGFSSELADIATNKADNSRVDLIITTPAEGVSAQEIIDARQGEASLGAKITKVEEQINDLAVNVKIFGAKGDGVTDDTVAIQSALDYASTNKLNVYCSPDKTYVISSIRIKDGIKSFICKGTIKGKGTSINGIIQLDGQYTFGGTAVQNCTVSVNLDMSAGDMQGIVADEPVNCIFENNHIYGFVDDANKKYGLFLKQGAKNNIIRNNKVEGFLKPLGAYQYGIVLIGNSIAWGGYFDGVGGTAVRATIPVKENSIYNNQCFNGTHGIIVNAGEKNIINMNVCKYNSHRGIILEPVCYENIISNNQLIGFGSAGVLMGYGCEHNLISNNEFNDDLSVMPADGEGSITAYVGCKFNKIIGNKINSQRKYGVYLAVDIQDNIIENNTIKNYRLAGIGIDSDWIPVGCTISTIVLPTDAKYSRPSFDTTPMYDSQSNLVTRLSYGNTENNVIQNNNINEGFVPAAALYIAQLGENAKVQNNIMQNNVIGVLTSSLSRYIYLFEDKSGYMLTNKLKNNSFLGVLTIAKFYMSRWRNHFNIQSGNEFLDTEKVTFVAGDTTPSVKYGSEFWCANTVAVSITNFIDSINGQEILVRLDSWTTIVYNSSLIRLKGNANITPLGSNGFVRLKNITGIWFEIYRNF